MMAWYFNGSTGTLTYQGAVVSTIAVTMDAWARADSAALDATMVGLGNTGTTTPFMRLSIDNTAGQLRATYRSDDGAGGGPNCVGSTILPLSGPLQHYAGTYSNAIALEVFINGVSDGTFGSSVGSSAITLDRANVGCLQNGGSQIQFWPGPIAEAAIWNVVLTPQEIRMRARGVSALRIRPQNLVFYTTMDRYLFEHTGKVLTVQGSPVLVPHPRALQVPEPPVWTFGEEAGGEVLPSIHGSVLRSSVFHPAVFGNGVF